MKNSFLFLLFLLASSACADILHIEGIVPPDVDKAAMNAEYHRIYRLVAPRQRPDPSPLRVVYYSEKSTDNFNGVLPEWGGGGTIGGNLIVIPTTFKPFLDQSFAQVTRHELVHAVLARAYPGLYIPRWFHEGVAMTLSGELSFQEDVIVSKAIFTGARMPFASIDSVNNFGRNRADLAYAKSHLAVLFLVDRYGIESIPDILSTAKRTGTFWEGMHNALALSPSDFDYLVNGDISSRYRFAFIFADYSAFWVAIAFLFLVAAGVALVRKRKKLDQMEREEKLEDERSVPAAEVLVPEKEPPELPGQTMFPSISSETMPDGGTNPDKEEYLDDDEYYDEDDNDYILADGVELEDEENFADGDEEQGDWDTGDDGASDDEDGEKKS
jgi:hypothetical protein